MLEHAAEVGARLRRTKIHFEHDLLVPIIIKYDLELDHLPPWDCAVLGETRGRTCILSSMIVFS